MTEQKDEKEEKKVRIYHTGKGYGPMDTKGGKLMPGHSIEVAEETAKKITGAYAHIKLVADVIPEETEKAVAATKEKASLEAKVKDLEGKLSGAEATEKDLKEAHEVVQKRDGEVDSLKKDLAEVKEGHKKSEEASAKLTSVLQDFLKAGSKKDLEDLQKQYKDIAPKVSSA